jgi:CheY-like chemotaxis protein
VDDDPSVLEMMTRLSRAIGLTPVGVDSGEAALKLLETDPHWLVVIMDQTMPGLSGTDTLRRLRENHPDLPVLLVSGQSDAALDEMTFGGPTLFLPKPFTLRQLRHSLSSLLQRNG